MREFGGKPRKQPNPFSAGISGHPEIQTIDAEGRIRKVQEFTIEQCNQALHVKCLQKTVALAILRRVRKIKTEELKGKG